MSFKEKIDNNKVPAHVAIIMDGNGRWARKKGNKRIFGHQNGVTAVRQATEAAGEINVKYLTLYAFSTENWNRPQYEIDGLMQLLVSTINTETDKLIEQNVRLLAIGDLDALAPNVKNELLCAIDRTAHCSGLSLVIAISYSARWEITNAVKKIIADLEHKKYEPENISQDMVGKYLTTQNIPDPELLIRTSGEYRISNFLLWQIAYTELYFTPILWPDFRKEDFFEAIVNYQSRERRFGKTSEQIENEIK